MQADSHCTREISPEGSESLNAPHDWITTGPQGAVLAGFVSVVLGDVLELTTGHVPVSYTHLTLPTNREV